MQLSNPHLSIKTQLRENNSFASSYSIISNLSTFCNQYEHLLHPYKIIMLHHDQILKRILRPKPELRFC